MSTPFYDLASLVVVPSGYKASKVYAQKPLTTDGQLTFSRASTATRVNASGALETVSSNVPRLDYSGGATCPKLLLEPQRVNRLTQSNNFSHADWSVISFGPGSSDPVVTANYTTSPFGTNDAWRLQATIGSSGYSILQQSKFISGQHTASIWVKSNTSSNQSVYFRASVSAVPKTVTPTWTRISVTEASGDYLTIGLRDVGGQTNVSIDISIYAGQLEDGAYPTSLIPTTTAAVTRLGERPQKTGIGSLIGGTSGTVFFEIKTNKTLTNALYKQFFYYQDASSAQAYMYLASNNLIVTNPSFGSITSSIALQADTTYKVAIAYASNDFKLYINGVERGSSTSGTPIDAVNIISIGSYQGSSEFNEMTFAQYLHFKSRLTNAQLAELT